MTSLSSGETELQIPPEGALLKTRYKTSGLTARDIASLSPAGSSAL